MGHTITQRELMNGSGEIMRRFDEGESFVVTRNGVPVEELTPLRRLRFVTAEFVTETFRADPAVNLRQFRQVLDENVSQEITPRG